MQFYERLGNHALHGSGPHWRQGTMTTVTVVFQSGKGHTRILAEAVERGVRRVPGVSGNILEISGKDVNEGRFTNQEVMRALDASDGIVLGCETTRSSIKYDGFSATGVG